MSPERFARQEWARALMDRAAGPVPAYGTPEWVALPDGPEKVAAVVRAAECWAIDGDELEWRLRYETEWTWRAAKRADDAERLARIEQHRAQWTGKDWQPHPVNRRKGAA